MGCREAKLGDALTPREVSIRDGLCAGKPIAEICRDLGIADGTARYYVPRVYAKLGARNARDMVRIVLTERLGGA